MSPDHGNVPAAAGRAASLAHQAADSTAGEAPAAMSRCARAGKLRATLMASFALAGRAVHPTAAGGFLVTTPHGRRRHCRDFEALQSYGREIGVA